MLLLLGWGLDQRPCLIDPDVTLRDAAAPAPTIVFMLVALPSGALLQVPPFWLLFHAFKATRTPP